MMCIVRNAERKWRVKLRGVGISKGEGYDNSTQYDGRYCQQAVWN